MRPGSHAPIEPIEARTSLKCEFCQGTFVPDFGGRHFCPEQGNRLVHIDVSPEPLITR